MFLNKFSNNLDDTPLHSSGYAEVARPNKIGSMSPQSFTQRLHIEKNRQSVGKYHHSMIASGHHRNTHYQRAITSTPARPDGQSADPRANTTSQSTYRRPGRVMSDVKPIARQGFSEPTGRSYNPYK